MKFATLSLRPLGLRRAAALLCLAGAAAWMAGHSRPAHAQGGFPDKPVTIVIPFAAGGPTDVVARMLAVPMGKSLGQPVIVENAAGAGGTIAAAKVARAPANGYTVLLHHRRMIFQVAGVWCIFFVSR